MYNILVEYRSVLVHNMVDVSLKNLRHRGRAEYDTHPLRALIRTP